jgi:hypothetical protein
MLKLFLISVVLALLTGRLAQAQIVNGSFEDSLSGWTVTAPPPTGTLPLYSPLDRIHGKPGSCLALRRLCPLNISTDVQIEQTAILGDSASADSCEVSFDMFVGWDPCLSTNVSHSVRAFVDGWQIWRLLGDFGTHPYQHITLTAPAGHHHLKLWFHVYNGAYLWVDNIAVTPTIQVPVRPTTWSHIKLGYR